MTSYEVIKVIPDITCTCGAWCDPCASVCKHMPASTTWRHIEYARQGSTLARMCQHMPSCKHVICQTASQPASRPTSRSAISKPSNPGARQIVNEQSGQPNQPATTSTQLANQTARQPVSQVTSQQASQPTSLPTAGKPAQRQPASQPADHPASQPSNQPINQTIGEEATSHRIASLATCHRIASHRFSVATHVKRYPTIASHRIVREYGPTPHGIALHRIVHVRSMNSHRIASHRLR